MKGSLAYSLPACESLPVARMRSERKDEKEPVRSASVNEVESVRLHLHSLAEIQPWSAFVE